MPAESIEMFTHTDTNNSVIDSVVASAWDTICGFDSLRAPDYELVETGSSSYVLLVYGKQPVAVKIPRPGVVHNYASKSKLHFEALVACHLSEASPPADLAIPSIIDSDFESSSPYAAFEIVPGQVLGYPEINGMSPAEKRLLGTKIGAFVGWMGNAISIEDYHDVRLTAGVSVFDRTKSQQLYAESAAVSKRLGCLALDRAHDDVWETLLFLDNDEVRPRTIGHDDLRPDNISFEQVDGLWQPAGVVDFGLVKPTSPARDLRFMPIIGDEATKAAAEAYEAQTGKPVSVDMVQFWAQFQMVTQTVSGIATNSLLAVTSIRSAFERLLPGEDWSELDRFC